MKKNPTCAYINYMLNIKVSIYMFEPGTMPFVPSSQIQVNHFGPQSPRQSDRSDGDTTEGHAYPDCPSRIWPGFLNASPGLVYRGLYHLGVEPISH